MNVTLYRSKQKFFPKDRIRACRSCSLEQCICFTIEEKKKIRNMFKRTRRKEYNIGKNVEEYYPNECDFCTMSTTDNCCNLKCINFGNRYSRRREFSHKPDPSGAIRRERCRLGVRKCRNHINNKRKKFTKIQKNQRQERLIKYEI